MRSSLFVGFLCFFQVALGDVDSSSLLWPKPAKITAQDSEVMALDSEKFMFTTDINSATLDKAFQRYMGIIFQTPTPFTPEGAPQQVTTEMKVLKVTVTDGDETLGEDTDESC